MKSSPHPWLAAIIAAIFGKVPIGQAFMREALTSISLKVNNAYSYAKTKYTLGLPQGRAGTTTTVPSATLEPIIATDLNITNGVVVDYNILANLDYELVLLPLLMDLYGYNPVNNTLATYPSGFSTPPTYSYSCGTTEEPRT